MRPLTSVTVLSVAASRLSHRVAAVKRQDDRRLGPSPTTFGKDRIPPGLGAPCLHAATCPSCSWCDDDPVRDDLLIRPTGPQGRRTLVVPVHITDPPGGARRKVQAFAIALPATKDTVGDARSRVRWGNDTRERDAVSRDDEDAEQIGVADEEIALGIDREAIGAGVAEGLDCVSAHGSRRYWVGVLAALDEWRVKIGAGQTR